MEFLEYIILGIVGIVGIVLGHYLAVKQRMKKYRKNNKEGNK